MRSSLRTRTAASFPGPRRSSRVIIAGLAAGLLAASAWAQETRISRTPEQIVEGVLGNSVTVRRQALQAAVKEPAEVVPLLVKALETRPPAALSFDAVRSLGDLKDPRLSAALVALYRKAEFLWKPQALEALADHAFPGAVPLFAKGVASPNLRSRAASCRGIAALGIQEMDPLVTGCLGDDEASVRLEAAKALIKLKSDFSGVPVVVRDLSLDRRFADVNCGSVARDQAAAFLKSLGGMEHDTQPEPATVAEMARIRGRLRQKFPALESVPPAMLPHDPDVAADRYKYAIEVRSCPEGDLYLRFDDGGSVVFGRDLLRSFTVDPTLLDPLRKALQAMDTGKGRRIVGPVSCDFERLSIRGPSEWRTLVIGTGRHEPSLAGFDAAVVEVVRKTRGDEMAAEHLRRVAPFSPPGGAASRAESRPEGPRR